MNFNEWMMERKKQLENKVNALERELKQYPDEYLTKTSHT